MQNELYEQYLQLLAEIEGVITQLNEVEKRKIDAVHKDDLLAVDECIRQDQAISLTMRSLESRRRKQLTELGLSEVKLSGLAAAFPADLRQQAAVAAERLQNAYHDYNSISAAARNALERGLREIDRMMQPPQPVQPPEALRATAQAAQTGGLKSAPKLEGNAAKPGGEDNTQPRKKLDFGA